MERILCCAKDEIEFDTSPLTGNSNPSMEQVRSGRMFTYLFCIFGIHIGRKVGGWMGACVGMRGFGW